MAHPAARVRIRPGLACWLWAIGHNALELATSRSTLAPDLNERYGRVTARYYDRVYSELRDPVGDVEFYLGLARKAQGPVLELGVGTGRVLLRIAAEGFPCTGLDLSPAMLEALRGKAPPPTLRLVCGPMQEFDLGSDRFSLVLAPFRAFQHLCTVEDQLGCLTCVQRHLSPDGAFAFDVFAPRLESLASTERPEEEDARFNFEGEEVIRYTAVTHDRVGQILQVRMRYERRQGDSVVGEDVTEFRMRYFFRYELEHLLARAGFDRVEFYGDFDGRPYDYVSGHTIAVARPAS